MNQQLNTTQFAAAVRTKRGDEGLRNTAKAIGHVSAATLSRVEQGRLPDVETFLRLCKWLGAEPSEFALVKSTQKTKVERAIPELIEAHLRADRALSPETADALI